MLSGVHEAGDDPTTAGGNRQRVAGSRRSSAKSLLRLTGAGAGGVGPF